MTAPKTVRVLPTEFPVTARSTIWPDTDLELGEAEWTDLYRQGLLLEGHDGTTEERQSIVQKDPALVPAPPVQKPGTPSGTRTTEPKE